MCDNGSADLPVSATASQLRLALPAAHPEFRAMMLNPEALRSSTAATTCARGEFAAVKRELAVRMTVMFAFGNPKRGTCQFLVSPGTQVGLNCCAGAGVAWLVGPVSPKRIVDCERRVLIVPPGRVIGRARAATAHR